MQGLMRCLTLPALVLAGLLLLWPQSAEAHRWYVAGYPAATSYGYYGYYSPGYVVPGYYSYAWPGISMYAPGAVVLPRSGFYYGPVYGAPYYPPRGPRDPLYRSY